MYAVIVSGGKQHRVEEGETLKLEKIEVAPGEPVNFDQVLLVANGDDIKIGTPIVDGAQVSAEVVSHGRADKIKIIKFRRRKHSMKRQGHRQWYTEVKITDITLAGAKKASKPKAKAEAKPAKVDSEPKASAPASDGDIAKISGVGPVLVKKLTGAGIITLQQIADFTPEDIERIDAELDLKGRIERDNWVAQARQLIQED